MPQQPHSTLSKEREATKDPGFLPCCLEHLQGQTLRNSPWARTTCTPPFPMGGAGFPGVAPIHRRCDIPWWPSLLFPVILWFGPGRADYLPESSQAELAFLSPSLWRAPVSCLCLSEAIWLHRLCLATQGPWRETRRELMLDSLLLLLCLFSFSCSRWLETYT